MSRQQEKESSFEKAFGRLEQILEAMNADNASLDESLALYEEADALIAICSKRLNSAEQKIEMLMKKRDGALSLDSSGEPQRKSFQNSEEGDEL